MRFCLVILTLALASFSVLAQDNKSIPPKETPPAPQVDVSEVLRRGDSVTVVGEGSRGAEEEAIIRVTAPPPDDSYMWFITVIKTENCKYCDRLISDFQRAPELTAFVAAATPYKPWAHFNIYNSKDETQKWRLEKFRVSGYPTLVIQPPRNGVWGNPRTVVWQKTGYGDTETPKSLQTEITNAVRRYAAAMSRKGYPKTPMPESEIRKASEGEEGFAPASPSQESVVVGGAKQVGVNPPFVSPPASDPFNPQPGVNPVQPVQTFPPQPQPVPTPATPQISDALVAIVEGVLSLFTGQSFGNLLLLIMVGMWIAEWVAPQTPTKVDDQIVAILKPIVDRLRQQGQPIPPITVPRQQDPNQPPQPPLVV